MGEVFCQSFYIFSFIILTTESIIFPSIFLSTQYPITNFSSREKRIDNDEKLQRILVRRSTEKNSFASNETTFDLDERCNSAKLQQIMQKSMYGDYRDMKHRITNYAEQSIGGLFSVICSPNDFSYVTTTRLYCLHDVDGTSCFAFLIE